MCTLPGMAMAGAQLASGGMSYLSGRTNRKLAERDAATIRALGAVEEAALRRQQDFEMGQQQVDIAANGRSISAPSALQLAFQSRLEAERKVAGLQTETSLRATRRVNEGRIEQFNGTMSFLGQGLSAASTLLKSVNERNRIPALG